MMRQDEWGYIVVETIGAFMLLVFLMLSILSLVNIVTLQARIHYAMTQAAETVSMYCYTLDVIGAAGHIKNNAAQAEEVRQTADGVKENINEVIDGIYALAGAGSLQEVSDAGDKIIAGAENTGSSVYGIVENAVEKPEEAIRYLLNYGLNESGSAIFGALMRPLIGRYLSNGSMTGDDYLNSVHVIGGLNGLEPYHFNLISTRQDTDGNIYLQTGEQNSTLLDSNGYVWINVRYYVDYTFGALPLPFKGEPITKLEINQTVVTKAWLSGNGDGYKK